MRCEQEFETQQEETDATPLVCSNTRTSLSTLNLSTLSVLTEYAEYADLSVFQIKYSAVH